MPPKSTAALTQDELASLEAPQKSRAARLKDKVILFLPCLAILLAFLEYMYWPNLPGNSATHVYTGFLLVAFVIYLIYGLLALFYRPAYKKLRHQAPFHAFVFFLLMVYDILTLKTGTLVLPYFPWVDQVFNAIIGDYQYILECLLASLLLLIKGYLVGAVLGLITGILCGYFDAVRYWIAPFMKVIGSIPTTTWLPIVMVLAATLHRAAVFIIALGVWFALNNATYTGIRTINPEQFEIAQTLGANSRQLITKIAIPATMPNIFQGLVQGMSTACTSLIVAEMVGVESGLGWYVTWQKSWASYDKMYAGILVICLLFLTVNGLLDKLQQVTLKWKEA